jgi:hypothetical protein
MIPSHAFSSDPNIFYLTVKIEKLRSMPLFLDTVKMEWLIEDAKKYIDGPGEAHAYHAATQVDIQWCECKNMVSGWGENIRCGVKESISSFFDPF